MTTLTLMLLGPPHIEIDGVPITIHRRRGVALLAYLALQGEPQPRQSLAALFWPESDHDHAHKSLRRDLSELNLALHGQWLEVDQESIGLRRGLWLDVAHFQHYLADSTANITTDPAATRKTLMKAVKLYRADFLTGFSLADSPQFDEWQRYHSEHLRQAYGAALARLVEILSEQDEDENAIEYARRWLNLDSLHEAAHRRLMHLYARTDQQAAAIRQYESCRALLQDELGVLPSLETTALYEQVHARKIIRAPSKGMRDAPTSLPRHNLPTQTTAFIGREREVADIQNLVLSEAQCRLLNLVGPGGIGKTRLALTVASKVAPFFANGVCFVSLAPIGEAPYTLAAIAAALHFNFSGKADPKEQLLAYLSERALLLVLDNFEHLLDASTLLSEILSHAADVVLLVTSRSRLNLREEWCYEVQGLTFPPDQDQSAEPLSTYSALQLFVQRARQTEATFVPSPTEIDDIARICRLVQGMPLGIELAAPWIRSLRCSDIAVEIERNLDFLTTTLRNIPERHRSLRVVFEQTWQHLSPAEGAVLSEMSLFRGGCTRHAAEMVTGASLETLTSLVDKALLRRLSTGRYELHELVRQFSETKLRSNPASAHEAERRYRAYFVSFLEVKESRVKGRGQKEALLEIKADIDNIRLAWRGIVEARDVSALERCAECLFVYYLYGNGYDEGHSEFGRAVSALAEDATQPRADNGAHSLAAATDHERCQRYLLAAQGYFLAHRFDLPAGQRLLEQALARLRKTNPVDQRTEAFTQLWLGWALYFQGRTTEGRTHVSESLAYFRKVGDAWGEGWSLLGFANFIRDGRPAEAAELLKQGVTLCQDSGDLSVLSYFCLNLSYALRKIGDFAEAQPYADQSVDLAVELDNLLGLGYSHCRKGQLEIDLGYYREAIQTLQQSAAYFQEIGTVHRSIALNSLGKAFHLRGEYKLARQSYLQALEGFHATGNRPWLARSLTSLGTLARDLDQWVEAEHYFLEALALWQTITDHEAGVTATLAQIGQLLAGLSQHRHSQAHNYLHQALVLAEKHQLAPLALECCLGVAALRVHENEREEAINLLNLPANHSAATFDTRQRARQNLVALGAQFPMPAHQGHVQLPALWETVRKFL